MLHTFLDLLFKHLLILCSDTVPSSCICIHSYEYKRLIFSIAVDCGVLDDPENGEVSLSGTTLGSKATYSCNDRYVLEGESTRVCQSNGKWSGEAPTCERKSCF